MNMKKQDLLTDPSWKKYVKKKNNTSEKTLGNYLFSLVQFCNANNKRFDEIIQQVLEEQYPYIDEYGRIHEYNPNYGTIDIFLYRTVDYLHEKGNKNNSILAHLNRIRTVLHALNIKLPDKIELENEKDDWYVLSKDDIKFVNSISSLSHQTLFTFMAHGGFRKGDVIRFTIEDFMEATFKYHGCTELDDFLEKAPEDMIGYWQFKPQKTKKHNLICKVYNTPESSNLLLRSLHRRQASIQKMNEKKGTNYRLEKKDALFSSRKKNFKGPFNENTITTLCTRRNKELQKHHKRLLQQELKDGKISEETYNRKLEEIPIFHAHGLRKFFITTLARKRVDIRASAFLEGHKPLMKHDSSYVDHDNLEDLIFEEYMRIIPALSLLKDEEDFELGQRNHDLQIENTQLKHENEKLKEDSKELREGFRKEAKKVLDELLRENNITL